MTDFSALRRRARRWRRRRTSCCWLPVPNTRGRHPGSALLGLPNPPDGSEASPRDTRNRCPQATNRSTEHATACPRSVGSSPLSPVIFGSYPQLPGADLDGIATACSRLPKKYFYFLFFSFNFLFFTIESLGAILSCFLKET